MNPTDCFLKDVSTELIRARGKFPNTPHLIVALAEEVGELSQALIQMQYEPQKGVTALDVYEEAVQVAALAVRIATEGDSTLPAYDPRLVGQPLPVAGAPENVMTYEGRPFVGFKPGQVWRRIDGELRTIKIILPQVSVFAVVDTQGEHYTRGGKASLQTLDLRDLVELVEDVENE